MCVCAYGCCGGKGEPPLTTVHDVKTAPAAIDKARHNCVNLEIKESSRDSFFFLSYLLRHSDQSNKRPRPKSIITRTKKRRDGKTFFSSFERRKFVIRQKLDNKRQSHRRRMISFVVSAPLANNKKKTQEVCVFARRKKGSSIVVAASPLLSAV